MLAAISTSGVMRHVRIPEEDVGVLIDCAPVKVRPQQDAPRFSRTERRRVGLESLRNLLP
jgi:hypothetical protein